MKKKVFLSVFLVLFFSACLSKSAPAVNTYELSSPNCAQNGVNIGMVFSSTALQTRSIFIKEDEQIKELKNARFLSFPEDMVENAFRSYFGCKQSIGKTKLDVYLLTLFVTDNEAQISAKIALGDIEELVISKIALKDNSQKEIIKALNSALNELLAKSDEFVGRNVKL